MTAQALVRTIATASIVLAIVVVFRVVVHTNPATVGFTLLLAVLVVSAFWGLRHAIFTAVVSTLAYNYFFLPPVGTFIIAEPGNWIALIAFLVTAIIGSELSERARSEAAKSNRRRQELEHLYILSQQMLSSDNLLALVQSVPEQVISIFGGTAAAIFLTEGKKAYYSDSSAHNVIHRHDLQRLVTQTHATFDAQRDIAFIPLRIAERSLGVLAFAGSTLSRESMEAIGSLVAIVLERARAVERLARAEATRESERLRSVLLDSVTHDFRTPLTAIKASAQSLSGEVTLDETSRHDLLAVISEESDRLDRLVGEAAQMAQLDSDNFKLELAPHHIGEAIDLALESNKHVLAGHKVQIHADESLPPIKIDLRRIEEVLGQLLDNAAKYSSPGTSITITAELKGPCLVTSVADRGPGIDPADQPFVFDKFYRAQHRPDSVHGTGMGLAIAKSIVELHGGAISVTSQPGHGSTFQFSIPLSS